MFRRSLRLTQAAQSISKDEFLEALYRVRAPGPRAPNYGLAISGGVDSMALALMCKEYMPQDGTRLEAFIVDHKLRPSSSSEASHVQKLLVEALGIPTRILPLPVQKPNMTPSNIETAVRTLRYRALGQACYESGINKLLLAHHQDDQIETIIHRLTESHNSGLRGIDRVGNIPECSGIYGVHESGSPKPVLMPKRLMSGVSGVEDGGIELGRPLLDFSKSRLIATCERFSVPWVEDETNKDRTLTKRNAIRHMLQHHNLPAALSKGRLLRLNATKLRQRNEIESSVNKLFAQCDIQLDIRTGALTVTIPEPAFPRTIFSEEAYQQRLCLLRLHLGRCLASLVSPKPQLDLSTFGVFANGSKPNFTTGKVHFKRDDSFSSEDRKKWTLQRQRFNIANRPDNHIITIPPHNSTIALPPFQLWDGRFWILVKNPTQHSLRIQHFTEQQVSSLRREVGNSAHIVEHHSSTSKGRSITNNALSFFGSLPQIPPRVENNFETILKDVANGDVRFTLPVITTSRAVKLQGRAGQKHDGSEDIVLAFPTLGLRVERTPESVEGLDWVVRYKKIDLGMIREEDCFVGLR